MGSAALERAARDFVEGKQLDETTSEAVRRTINAADRFVSNNKSSSLVQGYGKSPEAVQRRLRSSMKRDATKALKAESGILLWLLSPLIRALVQKLVDAILDELLPRGVEG